jgi:6-phosphogluconolactonase/glucosamine-6-phosphate isomerase/deaminase
VEGASDALHPEFLRFFPDAGLNREVAETLARKGELTGADLALLDLKIRAVGIEEPLLYRAAYSKFKEVVRSRRESGLYLEEEKLKLDREASVILSPELRKLLSAWWKFRSGQQELASTLNVLQEAAKKGLGLDFEDLLSQREWPGLVRLVLIQGLARRLNPEELERERKSLTAWLRTVKLSGRLPWKVLKKKMPWTRQSWEEFLKEAVPLGFRFEAYPQMTSLAASQIFQEELNARGLFREVENLFRSLFGVTAKTRKERELLRRYGQLLRIGKLLRLELTREEWERLEAGEGAPPERMDSRARDLWNAAVGFYRLTEARELAFLEKMKQELKQGGETRAILVTGGFHTEGLIKRLKESGVNFVTAAPRLSGEAETLLYHEVMLGRGQIEKVSLLQAATASVRQGWDLRSESHRVEEILKEKTGFVDHRAPYFRDRDSLLNRSEMRSESGEVEEIEREIDRIFAKAERAGIRLSAEIGPLLLHEYLIGDSSPDYTVGHLVHSAEFDLLGDRLLSRGEAEWKLRTILVASRVARQVARRYQGGAETADLIAMILEGERSAFDGIQALKREGVSPQKAEKILKEAQEEARKLGVDPAPAQKTPAALRKSRETPRAVKEIEIPSASRLKVSVYRKYSSDDVEIEIEGEPPLRASGAEELVKKLKGLGFEVLRGDSDEILFAGPREYRPVKYSQLTELEKTIRTAIGRVDDYWQPNPRKDTRFQYHGIRDQVTRVTFRLDRKQSPLLSGSEEAKTALRNYFYQFHFDRDKMLEAQGREAGQMLFEKSLEYRIHVERGYSDFILPFKVYRENGGTPDPEVLVTGVLELPFFRSEVRGRPKPETVRVNGLKVTSNGMVEGKGSAEYEVVGLDGRQLATSLRLNLGAQLQAALVYGISSRATKEPLFLLLTDGHSEQVFWGDPSLRDSKFLEEEAAARGLGDLQAIYEHFMNSVGARGVKRSTAPSVTHSGYLTEIHGKTEQDEFVALTFELTRSSRRSEVRGEEPRKSAWPVETDEDREYKENEFKTFLKGILFQTPVNPDRFTLKELDAFPETIPYSSELLRFSLEEGYLREIETPERYVYQLTEKGFQWVYDKRLAMEVRHGSDRLQRKLLEAKQILFFVRSLKARVHSPKFFTAVDLEKFHAPGGVSYAPHHLLAVAERYGYIRDTGRRTRVGREGRKRKSVVYELASKGKELSKELLGGAFVDRVIIPLERFGELAARKIASPIRTLQQTPSRIVNLVLATGNTMIPVLDALAKEKGIDWTRVRIFHLDEYEGKTRQDDTSFASYLTKYFLSKLPQPPKEVHFVGETEGRPTEYAELLRKWGGADVVLLGVGANGHVAFNEPPADHTSRMRRVRLSPSTVKDNLKDNPGLSDPRRQYARTMGIADILEGDHLFFLGTGERKANIVERTLEGPLTPQVPASYVRTHPRVTFLLDTAAAAQLRQTRLARFTVPRRSEVRAFEVPLMMGKEKNTFVPASFLGVIGTFGIFPENWKFRRKEAFLTFVEFQTQGVRSRERETGRSPHFDLWTEARMSQLLRSAT